MVTHASLTTFKSTRRCDYHLTLPYLTLPYSPHPTLPYPTLLTLPYPTLPYSTYPTRTCEYHLTLPYPTYPTTRTLDRRRRSSCAPTTPSSSSACFAGNNHDKQTTTNYDKHNTRAKARVAAKTRARARVVIRIPLHALSVGNGPKEFTYPSPLSQLLYVMCLDCCLLPLQEAGIPSVLGEATALAHTRRHAALSSLRAGETTAHQV